MRTNRIIRAIILIMFLNFSLAAAAEKIFVNYGPYTIDGQSPDMGTIVGWQQVFDHLTLLAPYVHWIRTYTCRNGLENVGPIAHSFGMGVVAGCWLSRDKETNDAELNALITVCQKGDADVALVGSETLYRGDLTGDELIGYINRFKSAVPGFPVMTADAHSALSANPSVVHAGDAVMANSYPYWDGISIMDAASHLRDSYLDLKAQFPDKLVVISETGWPTTGGSVGSAVPDPINAAWYFWCVESWAKTEGVVVFYFEAFDEPWKAVYEGSQGSHWGLFDQYGVLKPYMEYGFSNYILPEEYWK